LWVAIYGTFVLNFCDFTRNATSKRAIVKGNFWGIPLNMLVFGSIVITLAGAQFRIDGRIIEAPADIVSAVGSAVIGTVLFGTLHVVPGPDAVAVAFAHSATMAMGVSAALSVVAFGLAFALPRAASPA